MIRTSTVIAGALTGVLAATGAAQAAKQPKTGANQLTITATPTRVLYGRTVALAGRLSGPDHAGKTVVVEEDPYPFDAFKALSTTAATDASGDYKLTVQPVRNTRYRAVAKTSPDTTSPAVTVVVVKRVILRANDRTATSGQRITFSGKVSPAHDGQTVLFQRRTSTGSYVTLRTATLQDAGTAVSKYSLSLRVRSTGVYRTVAKADADHGTGKSSAVRVTVS